MHTEQTKGTWAAAGGAFTGGPGTVFGTGVAGGVGGIGGAGGMGSTGGVGLLGLGDIAEVSPGGGRCASDCTLQSTFCPAAVLASPSGCTDEATEGSAMEDTVSSTTASAIMRGDGQTLPGVGWCCCAACAATLAPACGDDGAASIQESLECTKLTTWKSCGIPSVATDWRPE